MQKYAYKNPLPTGLKSTDIHDRKKIHYVYMTGTFMQRAMNQNMYWNIIMTTYIFSATVS